MSLFNPTLAALSIIGGLALFLHGLEFSTRSFQKGPGSAIQKIMERVCRRRHWAFLFGCVLALVTQSTTAATSFAVGLVDLGVLPFVGSLLVMMGASVGTSFIVFLISLDVAFWSPLGLAVGVVMARMGGKRSAVAGALLQGLSLVLMGLGLIQSGVAPLQSAGIFDSFMANAASSPFQLFFISLALTAMVHSSVPVLGLAIGLASSGLLPSQAIVPVVLGSRIGASALVVITSFGARRNARALAIATVCFRLLGALAVVPLASPLMTTLHRLCGSNLALQISFAQFFVGWFNVAIMVPLASRLGRFSLALAGSAGSDIIGEPKLIARQYAPFPALALSLLGREMTRLAGYVEELSFRIIKVPEQQEPMQILAQGIPDLSAACITFMSAMHADVNDEALHREHVTLACSMNALNELSRVMIKHLLPLAPLIAQLKNKTDFESRQCLALLNSLHKVIRSALAALALGEVSMYHLMKTNKDRYRQLASQLRLREARAQASGKLTASMPDRLLVICDRLAQSAEELAWSEVVNQSMANEEEQQSLEEELP